MTDEVTPNGAEGAGGNGAADTGAEAELDLQALETMSSIRLNAMGIAGYWKRRNDVDQPS